MTGWRVSPLECNEVEAMTAPSLPSLLLNGGKGKGGRKEGEKERREGGGGANFLATLTVDVVALSSSVDNCHLSQDGGGGGGGRA